jgi:PAS domain S-box-containing protein/putative nucleotidyltransferase with HDIG domain
MGNPLRILLIDDDPDDRSLVIRGLRQEFPELQVKQIIEAVGFSHALEAGDFDLVITDYQLRWSDGLKVLRAVKSRWPGRPVIMFTGTGSEEIAVEAMKAGLDDYVLKAPKHFARLSAAVRLALDRVRQHQAVREAEVRYRSLFERVPVGLYRISLKGRILDANPALVQMLGYPGRESLLTVNAFDLYVDFEDRRRWQALMDRNGVVRNFEVRMRRYDGTIIWVENNARAVRDVEGRELYYEGSLEDITERKRAEERLRRSFETLRKTLEGTVHALAATAERRDPYTAGHQQRVTHLACAIAKDIDLPEERTEGIRVSGVLHDIGKIYVPAEILNKPGRLTEIEMGLIKTHPQVGYDILKTIEFPWPVAQIVLQHHERIDGSGYPSGLSGEDILLEARILAVADVIEAMASHRPYRPALGIDKALEEISQNRGVLYDPEVVEVCLRLFTQKGFKFEGKR